MTDYDDLKRKTVKTIEDIADATVETVKCAEDVAKGIAKKTKLRAGIVNDKATVRRLSVEIGSLYYKMFKDSPAPEFAQLCAEITLAYERIASKEAEIEDLKTQSTTYKDV